MPAPRALSGARAASPVQWLAMSVQENLNHDASARPVIIGVVGGVGAGKSAVAACLERLGCVVIDSDARAKAKLNHPAVKAKLVSWWGDDVLGVDGRLDREWIASIVFQDAAERRRLEELIHPMLTDDRAATIADSAATGAPGVVIDAPLLMEAGLDADCDAVIFVDAPRDVRLRRVSEGRAWDASELDRRESAQFSLEKKRERADYVVVNAGTTEELCDEVRRVFREILGKLSRNSIES